MNENELKIYEKIAHNGPQSVYDLNLAINANYANTHRKIKKLTKEGFLYESEKVKGKTNTDKILYDLTELGFFYFLKCYSEKIWTNKEDDKRENLDYQKKVETCFHSLIERRSAELPFLSKNWDLFVNAYKKKVSIILENMPPEALPLLGTEIPDSIDQSNYFLTAFIQALTDALYQANKSKNIEKIPSISMEHIEIEKQIERTLSYPHEKNPYQIFEDQLLSYLIFEPQTISKIVPNPHQIFSICCGQLLQNKKLDEIIRNYFSDKIDYHLTMANYYKGMIESDYLTELALITKKILS